MRTGEDGRSPSAASESASEGEVGSEAAPEPRSGGFPAPSSGESGATGKAIRAAIRPAPARPKPDSPYLRAENEDDDGYDPYSDRRSEPPLFERDPWS